MKAFVQCRNPSDDDVCCSAVQCSGVLGPSSQPKVPSLSNTQVIVSSSVLPICTLSLLPSSCINSNQQQQQVPSRPRPRPEPDATLCQVQFISSHIISVQIRSDRIRLSRSLDNPSRIFLRASHRRNREPRNHA